MIVKLTKLSESESPDLPAAKREDFVCGEENQGVSLFVEYELVGDLVLGPEIGQSMRIVRHERNGVPVMGMFASSPVTKIDGKKVYTKNSVYLLEDLS